MAAWVIALAWTGDRVVLAELESRCGNFARNFGNSVYPALPVSFGGNTKSRRSLLSGVYARISKISHQSAMECETVVGSTILCKLPPLWHWRTSLYRAMPTITQGKTRQCINPCWNRPPSSFVNTTVVCTAVF